MRKLVVIMFCLIMANSAPIFAKNIEFDHWHMLNIRGSKVLGMNGNYTLQMIFDEKYPLQIQAGMGGGGYKVGLGWGGGIGNLEPTWNNGDLIAGVLGAGIKVNYLRGWGDKNHTFTSSIKESYIGKYIGIEFSFALIFGIDVGYYRSLYDDHGTLTVVNIGLFY